MPRLVPFTLDVDLLPKAWGGTRLGALYGSSTPRLGEAWLCADLASTSVSGAGGQAMISDVLAPASHGPRTLHEVVQADSEALLGFRALRFPLLVKLLDAAEHLSVQVHPSPTYAASHPAAHLKSEAWYVLEAEPGAVLMLGVRDITSPAGLAAAALAGTLADRVERVPAEAGRCCWLPSGLVHALGGGSLVFEVQTASDTTFRLYDWAAEYARAPREMHVTEGALATDFSARPVWGPSGLDAGEGLVIETPDFQLARVGPGTTGLVERVLPEARAPRAHLIVPLGAEARLTDDTVSLPLPAARVTVVPATEARRWTLSTGPAGMALIVRVAAPGDGGGGVGSAPVTGC